MGSLLPLLLLYLLRSEDDGAEKEGWGTTLPLSLIVAAAWLTNVPAAVMLTYSLVLLAIILAILRRSPQVLWIASVALVIGFAMSSFLSSPRSL